MAYEECERASVRVCFIVCCAFGLTVVYEEYDFEAAYKGLLLLLQMQMGLLPLVLLILVLLALTPGTAGVTDALGAVVREVEIVVSDVTIQGKNGTPGPTMDANIRSCELNANLSYPPITTIAAAIANAVMGTNYVDPCGNERARAIQCAV